MGCDSNEISLVLFLFSSLAQILLTVGLDLVRRWFHIGFKWVSSLLHIGLKFVYLIQVYRRKKNLTEENLDILTSQVQLLVIAEALEIIIPLAYLVCFVAAYYGPNAELLGNIKNGYWHFKSVDEPWNPIMILLIVSAADLFSLIGVATFLCFASNINLLHVFTHLMKEYGAVFAIHIAFSFEHQFCVVAIACGLDQTLRFDWVLDQEHWRNITRVINVTN